MKLLVTGGTGFIGSELCRRLLSVGHSVTVLSRHPERVSNRCGAQATAVSDLAQLGTEGAFDGVINLAGASIVDKRWSAGRKRELRASRIALTQILVDFMRACDRPAPVLISASAIGYYGDQGDHPLDEKADAVNDFAHQLCRDWEREALKAEQFGTRVCLLRIGLVLGTGGGILQKMAPLFRLGLGGPLGSGEQWMSWIHRDDLLAMIDFLLATDVLNGVFNATAPHPVTNSEFSDLLARQYGRSASFRVPAFVLRAALGEMSSLLLGGQRVLPKRLEKAGFDFRYPHLEEALQAACH